MKEKWFGNKNESERLRNDVRFIMMITQRTLVKMNRILMA